MSKPEIFVEESRRSDAPESLTLRGRILQQRAYPKSLGYSGTAIGEMGGWRQGYEAAIDDVLRLLDEAQ
jgi:hypothetical protein